MEGQKKEFDLEIRTTKFASDVRTFVKKLPLTLGNKEDSKQLIRSSGSVGANYIETGDALGSKDFTMHMRISRKEVRESIHWLALIDTTNNPSLENQRKLLLDEADQLMRIFGKIVRDRTP